MSQDSGETRRSQIHRGHFTSLWGILAVDSTAVAILVVGLWWFIGSHEEGWPLAGVLLDPVLWLVVMGASVLGAMGNLALYYLGKSGGGTVFARFPNLEGERWEQVGGYYRRHGGKLLLFSAVPGLGTVLTMGASAFGIRRNIFLFLGYPGQNDAQLAASDIFSSVLSIVKRVDHSGGAFGGALLVQHPCQMFHLRIVGPNTLGFFQVAGGQIITSQVEMRHR